YPFGGGFAHTAANVLSVGAVTVPDIYGRDSSMRDVYALEADVQPGDSGGPLLTADATVAGVVFARGNADAGRGYAMTSAEVAPLVARAPAMTDEVSTGHCLG
ncbi:MAG: trypsin-like serine protease, partial [Actinobacteria bacterium]|nr:trypsin-like serine protease [Actinomycetota bacterium]